ncbi:MAG: FKBP-type peptidyl-prolyl cis-trans isomerase [Anditalea sp.]
MKSNLLYFMAALSVGLFSSCISDEETAESVFNEDLKKIDNFVQTTDIVPIRELTVANTGIVLLFTEENEGGETVAEGDSLEVNYTGYLLDGTVFDTSIEQVARDNDMYNSANPYEPYPVRLGYRGVIDGWHFALAQMKERDKATVLIPSIYAYGPGGRGPITPNSVLVFDLELVEVNKQ